MIKSYTDIEQSKKLAEILPLESADYCWGIDYESRHLDFNNFPYTEPYNEYNNEDFIPCWSFAALLGVLPSGYVIVKNYHNFYYVESRDHEKSTNIFNNPVDACCEMIIHLHELKML